MILFYFSDSLTYVLLFLLFPKPSVQTCSEEVTNKGLTVRWPQSEEGTDIKSNPLCYDQDTIIITRNCVNNTWIPTAQDLPPCFESLHIPDLRNISCSPGFVKISESNTEYCFKVEEASIWSYPCLQGGGATVITNLSDEDAQSVLTTLKEMNISRYYWLPARRPRLFNPILWYTPGKMWRRNVESNNFIRIRACIFNFYALLDIEKEEVISERYTLEYPSLCFYRNNIHYPAKCPKNYKGVRFTPDQSICAGIEMRKENLTFENFLNHSSQCTPMGDDLDNDLSRYVYKELANSHGLSQDTWCWFSTSFFKHIGDDIGILESVFSDFHVSINNEGSLRLSKKRDGTTLPCLACRSEVLYENTELYFEYNQNQNKMYLTVYHPSGLWKYYENDTGIQCFSDAKGLVKVIDINQFPFMEVKDNAVDAVTNETKTIEKIVYIIDLITDHSAQYWCEGHTNNFSLISTKVVIANPQGNDTHVFSLALEVFLTDDEIRNHLDDIMDYICANITVIFNAEKVLLMTMLTYDSEQLSFILHLHMPIKNIYDDKGGNIKALYERMRKIAETDLSLHNFTFVNISSSMYCLPTTSCSEGVTLEWELTPIGHIAAPKQFCLQANGLPVKRRCLGSYISGSTWGKVEGVCNKNYSPSNTTTFLYTFYIGRMPANDTFRFLTDGLGYVLNDLGIFIPADIYYLSISLQQLVNIAQGNENSVDMGTISNIAWIMNRVMILDNSYLRLAQTLNSTNVILDAVGEIIQRLAEKNTSSLLKEESSGYEIAKQPQFIIQICCPITKNVTGMAIKQTGNSSSFLDMEIIPLYKNTTYEDVLLIQGLEVATWIPENVMDTLVSNSNNTTNRTASDKIFRILISIYYNDAVFQALDPTYFELNSRIVGVTIPGFIPNLKHPIPLVFKNLNKTDFKKACGYWDFMVNKIISGFWSNRGCYLVKTVNSISVCNCYHLTHFGQLINIRERIMEDVDDINSRHSKPLNIISLIGSFLSLMGIAGIWLTAFVFQSWRKKPGSKVLLHLTAAIALPLIIIIVFNLADQNFQDDKGIYFGSDRLQYICIFLGALLHYSVLASFMWMLITAALQFIRYVRVLGVYRPSRFMIKFTLIGWGIPIFPVASILILKPNNYIPNSSSGNNDYGICYPSGFYLIVTVIVPICIILLINVILFISVIYAISHGPDGKMRSADIDLIGAQLRLSIFLFFLLGLTWIFGIFSFTNNLIWSYFFCLTSTLQGFVLFVYFIICDPITRHLWVTLMKPQFRSSNARESVTSISGN